MNIHPPEDIIKRCITKWEEDLQVEDLAILAWPDFLHFERFLQHSEKKVRIEEYI